MTAIVFHNAIHRKRWPTVACCPRRAKPSRTARLGAALCALAALSMAGCARNWATADGVVKPAGSATPYAGGAGVAGAPSESEGLFAVFETSEGRFVCRLFVREAPSLVFHFVGLAEGSQPWVEPATGQWAARPFYDGLGFHLIVPGFIIQSGCPIGDGRGDPGYQSDARPDPALRHDRAGILGLSPSRAGGAKVGSQFYITLAPSPHLDGVSPAIGEVFEGMDVVRRIGGTAVDPAGRPATPLRLERVRIVRR